jgi:hypothetical protein
MKSLILSLAIVFLVACINIAAQQTYGDNEIVNGDFQQENTGFDTEYFYTQSANHFASPGYYTIKQNPQQLHELMGSCKDHTGDDGNMMIVNGYDRSVYLVWSQTVDNLVPNREYLFSFWYMSAFNEHPATLKVVINGDSAAYPPVQLTDEMCEWEQFRAKLNTMNETSFEIKIYDIKLGINRGNDFALDDIEFRPVCDLEMITSPDRHICRGDITNIDCEPVGGFPPYEYEWSPKTTLADPFAKETEVMADSSRMYHVTITDSLGCTRTDSVYVSVMAPPDFDISASKQSPICPCEEITLSAPEGYSYFWSTTDTTRSINISEEGDYSVTIMDANGCINKSTIEFEYVNTDTEIALEDADASTGQNVTIPFRIISRNNQDICGGEDFSAKIRYNKSLLTPKGNYDGYTEGEDQIITIEGNTEDKNFDMQFTATLGNEKCTDIIIEEINFECAEPQITSDNSRFCLTNICPQPEDRLFDDTATLSLNSSPNPASDKISIDMNLIEKGKHEILIYNIFGELVARPFVEFCDPGVRSATFSATRLPAGVYYLKLRTPSQLKSTTLSIVK